MKNQLIFSGVALPIFAALTLQGCGGGGGSSSAPGSTPATALITLGDCFNNDVFYTAGTTFEIDEKQTSDSGQTFNNVVYSATVNGPQAFHGTTSVETVYTITMDNPATTSHEKDYSSKTSAGVFFYGWEVTDSPSFGRYNVPGSETPLGLAVNGQFTQNYDSHFFSGSSDTVTPMKRTVTFLGIESVTVPAGTFDTCKARFDTQADPSDPNSTVYTVYNWTIKDGRYKGLTAKWADSLQDPVSSSVTTKLLVNGS